MHKNGLEHKIIELKCYSASLYISIRIIEIAIIRLYLHNKLSCPIFHIHKDGLET